MDHPIKRSVLDVLMFLVEYCQDAELELGTGRETLTAELHSAGFASAEVEGAFAWLESLPLPDDPTPAETQPEISGMRVYTAEERYRLSAEARGLLTYLEQTGLLDRACLEGVIDRAMALEADQIEAEQLKWVLLMVLFNQRGQEGLFCSLEHLLRAGSTKDLH